MKLKAPRRVGEGVPPQWGPPMMTLNQRVFVYGLVVFVVLAALHYRCTIKWTPVGDDVLDAFHAPPL